MPQPNKSPAARRTAKPSAKIGFYELTDREDQLVRLGVRAGVQETVNMLHELLTGRSNRAIEDGAAALLRHQKFPSDRGPNRAVRESTPKEKV